MSCFTNCCGKLFHSNRVGQTPPSALEESIPAAPASQSMSSRENSAKLQVILAKHTHEIRNALQGVQGGILQLEDRRLDPETANIVRETALSCNYLSRLAQDFLDYSKSKEHHFVLVEQVFPMEDLKVLVLKPSRHKALAKGLNLTFEISQEVPPYIIGDKDRIAQILINFLSNATKFTDKGSLSVTISLEKDGDNERLRFAVSDTGKGISKGDIEKLFLPFAQIESDQNQGTGLGLSVCKDIAQMMNPESMRDRCIGVDSIPGTGSTFWFIATLKRVALENAVIEAVPPKVETNSFEHLQIMVVEDSVLNQKMLATLLRRLGCRKTNITIVSDGNDAVSVYKQKEGQFDVIFMDINMKFCGGAEAAHQIREYETKERKKRTCIIACTGNDDEEKYAGMDGKITKPVSLDTVKDVLSPTSPATPQWPEGL